MGLGFRVGVLRGFDWGIIWGFEGLRGGFMGLGFWGLAEKAAGGCQDVAFTALSVRV